MEQSNRLQLHNFSSSSHINWSKYETKSYLHFDNRVKIEHVKKSIQDPEWIKKHAFFPFIHFEIKFEKYVVKDLPNINQLKKVALPKDLKEKKNKIRKIYYSSHIDSHIYKYYGDVLNLAYNDYAVANEIDSNVLAYRNNKKGLNNIDFAYEVFDFLFNQKKAIIISLDFTSFFDNINHKKLKKNIKDVLKCDELPKDIYKIYKSITQFSYVNKFDTDEFLIQKYGYELLKQKKKDKSLSRIMNTKEYREFKKTNKLYKNKKPFGIPQGSGMSAVCSNIHLIHFDQELKKWADSKNALYRRYCDDLILVIPENESVLERVKTLKDEVINIVEKYRDDGLIIQREKTEIRLYENGLIKGEKGERSKLDYLGFVTDGETVKIREKSLFKYHTRAYRKARVCRNITLKTGKKFERGKLYKIYTHLGFRYKKHGNFISYAEKAHKLMEKLPVKCLIKNQIKRHWYRIHKILNDK
ncbi:reverse transcriptase domain-containing protein [Bacillus wiedmannii]|uniref:reverse transcriptase domain-containing protein n=1 Tax=Bacillus wiedmannii TaxID=1890302 RepID=UPI000BEF5832|nr:reverse transcriptase domain-containing protein [Bacillus wiedmannii]PEM24064.1 reverse transcriptase [Bacillus wiedmannii]